MARQLDLTRFARALLSMGSGASSWLLLAFALGVIAIGVFSNLLFTLLLELPRARWLGFGLVLLLVVTLVGLAFGAYRRDLVVVRRRGALDARFDERRIVPPHQGLIWLLSRGNLDLPMIAICHHHAGEGSSGHLRHCWVVLTPGAQDQFAQLQARIEEVGLDVRLHPVQLDKTTIEATYRAVDGIYQGAGEVEMSPEQIVADLTGGLKTMTAGMVMACLPRGRALEYIESTRDPVTGEPIKDTQVPILVGVEFTSGA